MSGGGGSGATIAYRRQFQHDDWFDGSDRVSAGGPRGFNGKFHSLEAEFDTISGVVGDIANAIALLDVVASGKNILVGKVGINNPNPQVALDVVGAIRQNKVALSGGDNNSSWSSLTYNNYHNDTNTDWAWPDLSHPSVTLEMDEGPGDGRFEIWTSAKNSRGYNLRFAIDGKTGFVGIGTTYGKMADRPLTIRGNGGSEELISFQNGNGDVKWHLNQNLGTNNPGLNFVESGVADGRLFLQPGGNVGIGTTAPGYAIDVVGRGRLRQNPGGSAGLWYWQSTPGGDRAFAGMYDDNHFGIWSQPATKWVSRTDLTNGDMVISGRLGVSGYPATSAYGGLGMGVHTWDLVAEGAIYCVNDGVSKGTWRSHGTFDLAENYETDMDLEAGDVVCVDPTSDRVVRSTTSNDTLALGVVSTKPGFLLNAPFDVPMQNVVPVMLSGRCPCKVVDENGPIRRGDLLTTSSTPGHAMKARIITVDGKEFVHPGTIIGKALGMLDSAAGSIDIFAAMA